MVALMVVMKVEMMVALKADHLGMLAYLLVDKMVALMVEMRVALMVAWMAEMMVVICLVYTFDDAAEYMVFDACVVLFMTTSLWAVDRGA